MPYAIDLFCGAGGFSEGILQAGFDIVFSSDRSSMVQETYMNRHEQLGLIQGRDTWFELADIRTLTADYIFEQINSLRYGNIFEPRVIDVMFGGPPCQGFSRLGKRDASDPRNMLFHEYLRLIRDIKPSYVVMENVTGMLDMKMLDFPSVLEEGRVYEGQCFIRDVLKLELEGLEYNVLDIKTLNAGDFGVPQQRNRVIFLAYRMDVHPIQYPEPQGQRVTVYDALGDLYSGTRAYSTEFSRHSANGRTTSRITGLPIPRDGIRNMEESRHGRAVIQRFELYREGENTRKVLTRLRNEGIELRNRYPELFYESLFQVNSQQNATVIQQSLERFELCPNIELSNRWFNNTNKRLAEISMYIQNQNTTEQLEGAILVLAKRLQTDIETANVFLNNIRQALNQLYNDERLASMFVEGDIPELVAEALLTKKDIRSRLDSNGMAPTMVTLPDDFIHPYFNRILTVREMARLQSFDDSFIFLGKRTTGGTQRANETPQFTQVGNAVPPLLARAIAEAALNAVQNN